MVPLVPAPTRGAINGHNQPRAAPVSAHPLPTQPYQPTQHPTGNHTREEPPPPALTFRTLVDLAAAVDAQGPRRWLLRGVWPAGDYGIHAAEHKAQKTWTTADLVISVASGTPWLGAIPVDNPGPVLMFVGEGGDANTLRRLRATAHNRDVIAETLPIVICTRAPHLGDRTHLHLLAEQVKKQQPVLVTIDPLYLSAAGANLGDLYAMGALLETPQRICQAAGAALWIVTHYNRRQGAGAARITGAGPAEWGRVLISADVTARTTEPVTRASVVTTELRVIGGEVPDRTLVLTRRIYSDDPDDLDAALHVECSVTETTTHTDTLSAPPSGDRLSPAASKLLVALRDADGPRSASELVDAVVARHGHGLTRQTVSTALNALRRAGFVTFVDEGPGLPRDWRLIEDPSLIAEV